MKTTEQLKNKLSELFESSENEDIIKGLGEINVLVDNLDKEFSELNDKHIDLVKNYTKMVACMGTKDTPTEGKEESPLTLEEIVQQVIKK